MKRAYSYIRFSTPEQLQGKRFAQMQKATPTLENNTRSLRSLLKLRKCTFRCLSKARKIGMDVSTYEAQLQEQTSVARRYVAALRKKEPCAFIGLSTSRLNRRYRA